MLREILAVRWKPGKDTLVALLTLALFAPIYWIGANVGPEVPSLLVFMLVGNVALNVAIPAYYLLHARQEPPSELGLTRRRAIPSLLASALLAALFWPGLAQQAEGISLAPHLVATTAMLWEPFFVHGWLQLRFERAFGILPGILLAGLAFGSYHLGTYPAPAVLALVGFGIFFAILFRLTRNLLILWPLTWGVSGAIGTLQGGFVFGWADAAASAGVLLVQLALLRTLLRSSPARGAAEAAAPA